MAQLNTTSNLQGADTQTLLGSFYPLNSFQTEPNEVFGNNSKQPTKPSNSSKVSANSSVGAFNVKRLVDLLEPQENMSKTNMKGTLSEAFNMTSFHSPTHSTLQTKSIRQKISNMKPAGSNFTITREETHPIKSIDCTGIPLDRFTQDSTGPFRETSPNNLVRQMIGIQVPIRSSQSSPPKENLDQKMKQISTIYRNQSILDHLRKSRAGLNTSKTDLHPHSRSRNYFGQINKAAWCSSEGPKSSGLVTNNADDPSKIMEPSRHQSTGGIDEGNLLTSKQRRNSCAKIASHGSFIHLDRNISKKLRQKKYSGSLTNANNSANSSFHSYSKDINPSSQNNISMEKTGVISGNLISQFLCGENNSSQINRQESIESKLEGLLMNKSVEPQNMEEINSLFDNFMEVVCENGNVRDPQKVRSMLRKIKLAYEIFFQNYSHSQNKKHAQAKECQQKLEDDCEILELKLNEMNIELQNLQKENEKLLLQNKLPKNNFSPASSLTTLNKYNQGEVDDTPPETKNGNSSVAYIETLKAFIIEQQNTINSMKRKENKMVKLLYACKQKGLDIKQIYYEDVKSSSQNYSERQEEDIPTVNKVSLNYPTLALNNLQKMQEGHYQDGEGYLEDSDCLESKSVAESGTFFFSLHCFSDLLFINVYEKYSNYDHCENNIQKPNLDPILQDQLRLDLSQLNQPKQSFPMDFVIHDQKPQVKHFGSKILKPKLQGLALNLNCIKKDEDEEKFKGFHEEFMSRMDEFSVSWRQAALKERKIP